MIERFFWDGLKTSRLADYWGGNHNVFIPLSSILTLYRSSGVYDASILVRIPHRAF